MTVQKKTLSWEVAKQQGGKDQGQDQDVEQSKPPDHCAQRTDVFMLLNHCVLGLAVP